jgi:hypothetical protein
LLLIAIVAIFFASCSKNSATHIPKDAFAVLVLDGDELMKFNDPDFVKENPDYKDAMKEIEKESKKAAELIAKVIDNPNASGILLKEKSYAFATFIEKEIVFGVIIPIDKKVFDENLDMIASEFNVPISTFMQEKNGIKYMEPESGMIFGWNKDVVMFVVNEASDDNFGLLEKYMNLDKKESILSNKDFAEFHDDCKALNLWVSSSVINNIDLATEELKEFESLTGIKLADNYGHFFLDIQKDQITYTTTIKFNESIQNLDKKKLMDNAEKIMELFEDPINSGMDLFGNGFDDDEDMEMDTTYTEMTDEEWEALMNDLETETN